MQILKNRYGRKFKKIFKTITFDNGSEFYKTIELENKNLQIYFTHPYSSYEKGGVENLNGTFACNNIELVLLTER